ncbi:hypothetical protein HPB52_018221 [Rhipicephalus sanguineus]|uniref:Uncharacterized protein n=1 Tax=Rhipicephalus sanguineus TaxID=34632 RepID=A0A9D4Q1S7_RHISA|nr:hypothetical protein HPB52_018221 [Rhipicephalus sanguineus]
MYLTVQCTDLINAALPLTVWKFQQDNIDNASRLALFDVYARLRRALVSLVAGHDSDTSRIEKVRTFLDLYAEVAVSTLAMLKDSAKARSGSLVHVPHLATNRVYRLLVTREIELSPFAFLWPVFHHEYPAAVNMGLLGTTIARGLVDMVYYLFFQDNDFNPLPLADVKFPPALLSFIRSLERNLKDIRQVLKDKAESQAEIEELTKQVIAGHLASRALATVTSPKPSAYFSSLPAERLFYMATCFKHCQWQPTFKNFAACNVVTPRLPGFARAFGCDTTSSSAFALGDIPDAAPDIVDDVARNESRDSVNV